MQQRLLLRPSSLLEAKARFIEQVKREEVDADEIEDIGGGDIGNAAAETKAIATGDPRYIRQVQLDDDVKRLALERAHREAASRRDRQIQECERQLARTATDIDTLAPVASAAQDRGDRAAQIRVNDTTYPERKDAAEPFAAACRQAYAALRDRPHWETKPTGATINGIGITARRNHTEGTLALSLDTPSAETVVKDTDLHATTPTLGLGGERLSTAPPPKRADCCNASRISTKTCRPSVSVSIKSSGACKQNSPTYARPTSGRSNTPASSPPNAKS